MKKRVEQKEIMDGKEGFGAGRDRDLRLVLVKSHLCLVAATQSTAHHVGSSPSVAKSIQGEAAART